ncbi:hypothetical protein GUJ93_ZPchr0006g42802 [Zizania palustris]|uniref:Uncharacterized protein n=1 Tax=Zizania palustris TaxID=103762 RepID=A0A8J5W1H3_ZIZPA|nr:hypothetical protein GUJ93_ZPchr0006g42802 [Zizania palustris]
MCPLPKPSRPPPLFPCALCPSRFRSGVAPPLARPPSGYIDAQPASALALPEVDGMTSAQRGARRFGVLTEEKARKLQAKMMETKSFHDDMYHSDIASRLASAAPGSDGKP